MLEKELVFNVQEARISRFFFIGPVLFLGLRILSSFLLRMGRPRLQSRASLPNAPPLKARPHDERVTEEKRTRARKHGERDLRG
jgi:hypothetical protein